MKRLKRKDLLFLANKLIEKNTQLVYAKERYESYFRKKLQKISKAIKNKYLSTKDF